MAQLILGTVQFGIEYGINNQNGKPSQEIVFEILEEAYQSGIKTLDTADVYGDAAEIIGMFHGSSEKKFQVNTKFSHSTQDGLKEKLNASIAQLNIDRVHTYFYHSYAQYIADPSLKKILQQLKEEKLIHQTGLSVYTNEEMQTAINDEAIDVIQFPFNLLDNDSQRGEIIKRAKSKNKQLQVRSVFLQGLFFKNVETLPAYLLPLQPYLIKIQSLAAEANLTVEELCLQYANAQPGIDEIIIGVDTKSQLKNNLQSLQSILNSETRSAVNKLLVGETALLYPYNWK